jgi:hypothetical protein
MKYRARKGKTQAPSPGAPPEWQVTVRRTRKEDGRYLIYYEFAPGPEAPQVELGPAAEEAGE